MKTLIVGGNFGTPKPSSIVAKISNELQADTINGGNLEQLKNAKTSVINYDIVIWMPNIDNELEKDYPKKSQGSVLICSKLMHDNISVGEAVSRIFKMNANAVIAIYKNDKTFSFKLLDALGNLWIETTSIKNLTDCIQKFIKWTKSSVRQNTMYVNDKHANEEKFCEIVKHIAKQVENDRGGRYFGNASTRCSYMFPSNRTNVNMFKVSGRNTPKQYLSPADFVSIQYDHGNIICHSENKPSVDTPVQMQLYEQFPHINYMIHGHAYIEDARTTKHYYPCGDLREVHSVTELLNSVGGPSIVEIWKGFCINLKNHGFLIAAETLEELEEIIKYCKFKYRSLEEKIENENY